MATPQCRGCKAIIRWIRMESGKPMPVDPERLTEYLVLESLGERMTRPEPDRSTRLLTLVTDEGRIVRGAQGSILTEGAQRVEGFVPHWSTCPKAKDFKPREVTE